MPFTLCQVKREMLFDVTIRFFKGNLNLHIEVKTFFSVINIHFHPFSFTAITGHKSGGLGSICVKATFL